MKRIQTFISVCMFFSVMAYMTGCEKKPDQNEEQHLIEDTTEIVSEPPLDENVSISISSTPKEDEIPEETETPELPETDRISSTETSSQEPHLDQKYIFRNTEGTQYEIILDDQTLSLQPDEKQILLINFFDINDTASKAQIPYLLKLQKKHADTLLIFGIPINTGLDRPGLREFIQRYQLNYFICDIQMSDALVDIFANILDMEKIAAPTTLLFNNGSLENVYEGAVPIEMMTHDILSIDKE